MDYAVIEMYSLIMDNNITVVSYFLYFLIKEKGKIHLFGLAVLLFSLKKKKSFF